MPGTTGTYLVLPANNELESLTLSAEEALIPTDGELIAEFIRHRGEATFRELVDRHGGLVMAVCKQILRHQDDADDAFQATFLVLSLRADSIKTSSSIGGWLYRVAHRTAMKAARSKRARRLDPMMEEVPMIDDPFERIHTQSLQKVLHEELSQLPKTYREPLVLCYLEQRSRKETAMHLESTEASVKARLARGKRMLRLRMVRRGVAFSAAFACVLPKPCDAAVSERLVEQTFELSRSALENGAVPSADVRPDVIHLVRLGTESMLTSTLSKAAGAACLLAIFSAPFVLEANGQNDKNGAGVSNSGRSNVFSTFAQAADVRTNTIELEPLQPAGTTAVQLAQTADVNSVLQPTNQTVRGASLSRTNGQSVDHKKYLLSRADAFEKLAKSWQSREASSDAERLEFEAKADLYKAEVVRLRASAKTIDSRKRSVTRAGSENGTFSETTARSRRSLRSRRSANPYADDIFENSVESHLEFTTPIPCCRKNNLAFGKPTEASSEEHSRNNIAARATDGNLSTRWCSDGPGIGAWLQIDLGQPVDLKAMRIHWESKQVAYQYTVSVSRNGEDWTQVVDARDNETQNHMNAHALAADGIRYLRITHHGSDRHVWASIREVELNDGELSPEPQQAWERLPDSEALVSGIFADHTASSPAATDNPGSNDLFDDAPNSPAAPDRRPRR